MTYDEESNLTVLKNVCTHCDEILSEYHYTYNEMGYVVTEEVTERVSVYCGKYHGDKEHGNFWRGKGHEYCQHEWFQYDDKGIEERLEAVNALVEETSLIATASHATHRRWGRWFKHPAYLYCTCHTKLVTTEKSYVYDDNWQILSCTTEAADHQVSKECYTYDEAGNRTSYERWNGHSKVEYIRYEYNSSNQLTAKYEQEGYDWFNTEKTLYTYDADGNLVKEEVEYRKYHDDDWYDDKHDNWWDNWFDDWFDWFGTDAVASAEEAQESEGTSLVNFGLGNQGNENDHHRPSYDSTYTTTTYAYDTENRLKAVREQGILLQAMTYDGDGNLAYELDYNVDAVVDGRCIYLPAHGTKAEHDLYRQVCDNRGWVRGDYTLTEYLNDVTRENVEVLAEYGRNYCSMTVYTYGNERIAATTFNGYGYHFGCHDHGYHNIFTQYEKWHDRWQIKDRWHNNHGNRPRTAEATYNYSNAEKFTATYGSYSSYHSGKYCGHKWKTAMSKIYYLYDGHGSVERVHGKDGSTFRLEYDTYGNLVAGIVERWHVWYNDIFAHRTANIYAYSGERYNFISGLQFLRARWYDTDTGRFISEDSYLGTQAEPLSRNRYIYTANNPVNFIDPSGHYAAALEGDMQQASNASEVDLCDMETESEPTLEDILEILYEFFKALHEGKSNAWDNYEGIINIEIPELTPEEYVKLQEELRAHNQFMEDIDNFIMAGMVLPYIRPKLAAMLGELATMLGGTGADYAALGIGSSGVAETTVVVKEAEVIIAIVLSMATAMLTGQNNGKNNATQEEKKSSGEIKEVHNSIKESPKYPEGFRPRTNCCSAN